MGDQVVVGFVKPKIITGLSEDVPDVDVLEQIVLGPVVLSAL